MLEKSLKLNIMEIVSKLKLDWILILISNTLNMEVSYNTF